MYKRTLSGEIRAGVPRADVYFLFATTIGLLFYVGLSVCSYLLDCLYLPP